MVDQRNRKQSIVTRVAQALHFVEAETGAVIPSIQPSATYARDNNYEIRKPYWYRRDGSQTTAHAEAIIAELENAQASLLFSSRFDNGFWRRNKLPRHQRGTRSSIR